MERKLIKLINEDPDGWEIHLENGYAYYVPGDVCLWISENPRINVKTATIPVEKKQANAVWEVLESVAKTRIHLALSAMIGIKTVSSDMKIPVTEYNRLRRRGIMLDAFDDYGVSDWDKYDFAMKDYSLRLEEAGLRMPESDA